MSGIIARRMCLKKSLPMFVLLASLFLTKCVSSDASSETAANTSSSVSEGTTPSTTVTIRHSTLSHPVSATTNIKTTPSVTTHASNSSSVNNTSTVSPIHPTTGESSENNTSGVPPANKTTNVSPPNNTTITPTESNNISSSEAQVTKSSNAQKETDATNRFSATTSKTSVIANTSDAVSSTKTNLVMNTTPRTSVVVHTNSPNSSGHTDVKLPLIPTPPVTSAASEGIETTVTQSSKMANSTPVSASTKSYNATQSTLSPVDATVTSTTSENNTMTTENGESTTNKTTELSKNMPCKNNNECNAARYLTCNVSSGQCTCMNGYSPMNENSCGKKLGAMCDGKCDAQNSRCETVGDKSLCVCEDGLTASTDGTFCYGMPLMFGDICDHDENCTIFGSRVRCKNFACRCEENHVRWNGVCLEKIDRLDAPCNVDTQVCFSESEGHSVNNKICFEGFCRCNSASGFVPHDGKCKKKISLLGAPCNASTHVCHRDIDGVNQTLQCHNGICKCKDTFLLEDGRCKKKIDVLGKKCSPGTEVCYADTEGDRRQCSGGTCKCKSSFVNENGICKQKISLLGAPCNTTTDVCYFEEDENQQKTHCKDGVCQCKAEFALTDKKCQKLRSANNHAKALFFGPFAGIPLIAVIAAIR